MPESDNPTPKQHLNHLDSARGIAALMVMAYHYINWTREPMLSARLASIVFNGSDAVSFFFVLSGFVLSYKYIVLKESLDIKKFYINRIFRLWPAFFVTILLNMLNVLARSGITMQNLTDTFLLNKMKFWEEAMLPWSKPLYYQPGWTLVIELSASFFLPFVIALAKKDARYVYWMTFVVLFFGPTMVNMFYFHFIIGVVISCLYFRITADTFRQTKWYRLRYPILIVAMLLYSIRHIEKISPLGPTYKYIAAYLGIDFFHFTAIASFVFIVVLLRSRSLKKLLSHKVLLFLGRISYGIYLMHWLLACDTFMFWDDIVKALHISKNSFAILFIPYAAGSILLATIIHYTVELPFIRIGKRITNKMKPSLIIE
jgi:peptidoglycan/LPS O-acetylase OafA/YrhL